MTLGQGHDTNHVIVRRTFLLNERTTHAEFYMEELSSLNDWGVGDYSILGRQNRSTEGCSKLKRSVDMTSSGKNGLNIRTNASPKWDRTRCPEE